MQIVKTYNEIQKTTLQANDWVIPEKSFGEAIEKFSRLSSVDNSWFGDKDTLPYFQFYIDENGEHSNGEIELYKLFQGRDL